MAKTDLESSLWSSFCSFWISKLVQFQLPPFPLSFPLCFDLSVKPFLTFIYISLMNILLWKPSSHYRTHFKKIFNTIYFWYLYYAPLAGLLVRPLNFLFYLALCWILNRLVSEFFYLHYWYFECYICYILVHINFRQVVCFLFLARFYFILMFLGYRLLFLL